MSATCIFVHQINLRVCEFTLPLQVYLYHGPGRNSSPTYLSQHDVVVTTYHTLAQDLPTPAGGPGAGGWQ